METKIIKIDDKVSFMIDADDYDRVMQHVWKYELHCRSKKPYIISYIMPKQRTYLHRFIIQIQREDKRQVDHINLDPADNRKCNLRICERGAQNAINRPKQKNNTSGYKGVFFRKDTNRFRAAIRVNQKLIHLGHFSTAEEAALCYNEAAVKYFGEFAYLNVINNEA